MLYSEEIFVRYSGTNRLDLCNEMIRTSGMFPYCGHFNQHMTIYPERQTPSIYTHIIWFQPKGSTTDVMSGDRDLSLGYYFPTAIPTRIPLSLSFCLWLWKIILSLWTFKSVELRVVVVMAHRCYEPQCTSLSPGATFVNSIFIKLTSHLPI